MKEVLRNVGPKGQVVIPLEIRQRLGIKPKDKVSIALENERVVMKPVRSPVEESYQAIPALKKPLTVEEMTEIASEEHAEEAAKEGIPT
jgi:AbrB family looped-hinge helix DNA binding protein